MKHLRPSCQYSLDKRVLAFQSAAQFLTLDIFKFHTHTHKITSAPLLSLVSLWGCCVTLSHCPALLSPPAGGDCQSQRPGEFLTLQEQA